MKSSILLLLIVVIVSAICIHAAPAKLEELHESAAPVALIHGERQRRVTCDLMSVDTKLGSLNHAACAAHCLAMRGGRRGGSCQNGVCVCRF